jgi:hypothetical protein
VFATLATIELQLKDLKPDSPEPGVPAQPATPQERARLVVCPLCQGGGMSWLLSGRPCAVCAGAGMVGDDHVADRAVMG